MAMGIRPLTGQQCSEKCDFTFLHCDHGWNGVMATTTACSFRVWALPWPFFLLAASLHRSFSLCHTPHSTFAFSSVSSLPLFTFLLAHSLQSSPLTLRARLYVYPLPAHYNDYNPLSCIVLPQLGWWKNGVIVGEWWENSGRIVAWSWRCICICIYIHTTHTIIYIYTHTHMYIHICTYHT